MPPRSPWWAGWVAALVLLVASLTFLSEALRLDRVFLSVDTLYNSPPFAERQSEDFAPRNPFLSDHATILYPWALHARQELREGEFPLWSPEVYGGAPFFGNLSVGIFFPLNWLYFVLPFGLSFVIVAVLKLWIAGLGLFALLRRLRVSWTGALLGATAYQFAGYNVLWLNFALSHVTCMAPLILWLIERWYEKPGARRGLPVSFALAASFLAGHPESTVCVWSIAGGALLCRGIAATREGKGGKPWASIAILPAVAMALCVVQLWPFAEYLSISEGRRLREHHVALPGGTSRLFSEEGWIALAFAFIGIASSVIFGLRRLARGGLFSALVTGASLALGLHALHRLGATSQIFLLLSPDFYGSPMGETPYTGPHTYTDVNGGFISALGLMLALVGALSPCRNFAPRYYALVLLVGLSIAFRLPPVYQVVRHLPVLGFLAETRALSMVALSGAVLIGFGWDRLRDFAATVERKGLVLRNGIVWAGGVLLALVALDRVPLETWLGGETSQPSIVSPKDGSVHRARKPIALNAEVQAPDWARTLEIRVDGQTIASFPRGAKGVGEPWREQAQYLAAARIDDGFYTADVVLIGGEQRAQLDGVTFEIRREGHRDDEDLIWIAGALVVLVLAFFIRGPWIGALAWLVLTAHLFRFGMGYNEVAEKDAVFPETEVTRFLGEKAETEGPFRVLAENAILQPNLHYAYGFDHLRGYDCIEPRRWVASMRYLYRHGGDVAWNDWNGETILYESRLFDLYGVRYIVSEDDLSRFAKLKPVLQAEGVTVWENTQVMPRVTIMNEAITLDQARTAPPNGREDQVAILETTPPSLGGQGEAELLDYQAERIVVEVDVRDGNVLLVLFDTWFPGWKVSVDGEKRELLASHVAFRAVSLTPGDRRVVFEYEPASFYLGSVISAVTFISSLVVLFRRPRRGRPV